ncbi:metal-dependent hydrolase [Legionella waltersii]|uniref:Integral membrane protein n=1 Tax=Legionella waltersii TaxID=66969 RepID=A0A0W1ADG2_9GAMM|nr:metal-dependent hydrolase [Legionella waltersii]KTD79371.1 integral membrane protein [Legionella waltersii]SNU99787.1 membrane-bound metal-dependent hydrolase [Legionella waltersii]
MDPITHAALGAASAQIIFGKYNKHIPWQVGALAGMAPDLDVFFALNNNPLSLEYWHRHFTHSLSFIPIGGMIVALVLICFPHFRKHWKITIGSALIAYATHSLLDAITSYGTLLLWPWSNSRISWDIVAIIDPVFTVPLILGTIYSVIFQNSRATAYAFVFCSLFLVFNFVQHQRAIKVVNQYAEANHLNIQLLRIIPKLASSTHWRAIIKEKKCSTIADVATPIFASSEVAPNNQVLNLTNTLIPNRLTSEQKQELALFSWFTEQQVIIANKNPLLLADGRYTLGVKPIYSLWGIELMPQNKHAKKIKLPEIKEVCSPDIQY